MSVGVDRMRYQFPRLSPFCEPGFSKFGHEERQLISTSVIRAPGLSIEAIDDRRSHSRVASPSRLTLLPKSRFSHALGHVSASLAGPMLTKSSARRHLRCRG